MRNQAYVAYYRVSTEMQGRSGLGLDAQQKSVRDYLDSSGSKLEREYIEIESGKNNKRPELDAAIEFARKHKATLLIAKLDRLSRNAAFILNLRDSKVDFTAVDMPDANRLTVGIMALMAEHEAEMISTRTKEALKAAKRRGVKLGNPQNLQRHIKTLQTQADEFASKLRPTIEALVLKGLSQREIAFELNSIGVKTPRKKEWKLISIQNLLSRLEIKTKRL